MNGTSRMAAPRKGDGNCKGQERDERDSRSREEAGSPVAKNDVVLAGREEERQERTVGASDGDLGAVISACPPSSVVDDARREERGPGRGHGSVKPYGVGGLHVAGDDGLSVRAGGGQRAATPPRRRNESPLHPVGP